MNKTKIATRPKGRGNGANGKHRNSSTGARGNNAEKSGEGNVVRAVRAVRGRRKELESAIQRYADLYEFAPVGYVTLDVSGRIEHTNLATCELLERKREYLVDTPFSVLVVPDHLNLFLRHLVRCRAGEKRVDTNLHLKKRGGERVSVLLSSSRTTDLVGDGRHIFQTAIVDLTARDRAEQALRDKEAELEEIVTQTPFMFTRCTRDLRYRYVSEAYAKMLGVPLDEIAGKPIAEIIGKEALATIRPNIDRVLAGETVSYEGDVPFKNRGTRFIHGVYVPDRDSRGKVVGWIASLIDVTERKKAEAAAMRLAAVVQTSGDAIAAKTLNGIVTDWNKSAERIFGYTAKEMIGKSILTVIPRERHKEETEILRRIRRGELIDHYETVRRRKDGKLIDVSLTISPVTDANGTIIGVSKIARDVSQQKKIERRLAEQARLLDLSNEAILVRDGKDRITYWNHGAVELYGYSREEALGKITHRLLRTEHPQSIREIFRELHRKGRWSGEVVHRRKNGQRVVVVSHWALDRDKKGERSSVLETNSDITRRK
ncbi:MAG: PAS domain S-box protein, partial [Verrucomicrobia bacterium]|nr:PAS domain S-box protein [Verrucomicrobiota bacterium]